MLKGKSTVYILIPLNILIWGFFIYRFYTAYNEGNLPLTDNIIKPLKLDELKDSVDYKLNLNYKDPFLRESEKVKTHNNANNAINNANKNLPKPIIAFKTTTVKEVKPAAEIKYLGLVKNNTTGVSTALISINGKSYLVKKGDIIDGLNVKSISGETIEVKEGKNLMIVSKN